LGSLDVGGIVMRDRDHFLTRGVEALDEVDLVIVSQSAVHEQRALVVVGSVEGDDDPFVTLNSEVTRVLLQSKRCRFQPLAKKTLRAAVHLVIRVEHE